MTTHPNRPPDSTTIPPAVYVDKLSFRNRSLDDEPQPKRKASTPAAEILEQKIAFGREHLHASLDEMHQCVEESTGKVEHFHGYLLQSQRSCTLS